MKSLSFTKYFIAIITFMLHCSYVFADEMQFRIADNGGNCDQCVWIVAEGTITERTPKFFLEFAKANQYPNRIIFNSPGGSLISGVELGQKIREFGYSTAIGKSVPIADLPNDEELKKGSCASACAFAFMGGINRQALSRNRLGESSSKLCVHQFYTPNSQTANLEATQALIGLVLLHVIEMGVDANVMSIASLTGPNDLYCFTNQELKEWGIDNAGEHSSAWIIEPYKAGMVMASSYYKDNIIETQMTLFCRKKDSNFRLLVTTKKLTKYIARPENLFTFDSELKMSSGKVLPLKLDKYHLGDDGAFATFLLPSQIEQIAERGYFLSPGTTRTYKSLFVAGGTFPNQEYIDLMKRNCI